MKMPFLPKRLTWTPLWLVSALGCGRTWTFIHADEALGDGGGEASVDGGTPAEADGADADAASDALADAVADRDGGSDADATAADADAGITEPWWTRAAGGLSNADRVYDAVVDPQGNAWFVGTIGSSTTFGCMPHTVEGGRDAFVVKYASDGRCLLSEAFAAASTTGAIYATGIAATPAGDIIIVGFFNEAFTLGDVALYPGGSNDVYLTKITAEGKHVWSRRYGTAAAEWAWDVARDGSNGIYVAGHYRGSSDLGRGLLPVEGDNDMFVAKFADADDMSGGEPVWTRGYGSALHDSFVSVGVNAKGDVIVSGDIQGAVDFDGIAAPHVGVDDIVVSRHSPETGQAVWVRAYGGAYDDRAWTVSVDGSRAWVGAWFHGSVDFGGVSLASTANSRDAVLLELDLADGSTRWGDRFGGPSEDEALRVASNDSGSIAIGGYFQAKLEAFGNELEARGGKDAFLITLDSNHQLTSAARYGGTGDDTLEALAWDSDRNLIAGGLFAGTMDVGTSRLTSRGDPDIWLARLRR
jgi:hypothetical protein